MTSSLIACTDFFLLHSAVKCNVVLRSQGNRVLKHLFFTLKQTETKRNMLHAIKHEMRTKGVFKLKANMMSKNKKMT